MNLIFRLIWVVLTARRRGPLGATDEGRFALRCWPNDLDANLHMNNGRYLTIMDLGRIDLIIRSGIWRIMRERKWNPVVGSAKIRFRRSIDPFQAFYLTTRILGWDEKWLYIEHRMEVDGDVKCVAVIKGVFLGPNGRVAMAELVEAIGHREPSPPLDQALVDALA